MLRALGSPVAFVGLAAGFVAAVVALHFAQAWSARAFGDRAAAREAALKRSFEPFGVVAAVISVPGWGRNAELRLFSPGRRVFALVMGPAAAAVLGAAGLAAYVLAGGPTGLLAVGIGPGDIVLNEGEVPLPDGQVFLLCAGLEALAVAVLAFVPLPPLTGWRLLALLSPRSLGWQRAHYWLEERNIGVVILLVLLILPLGVGAGPLLVELIDTIVGLLVSTVA